MEDRSLAKIANYENDEEHSLIDDLKLRLALDTLTELLNIDYGSVTIRFHRGKWSPKIEIQKSICRELKK